MKHYLIPTILLAASIATATPSSHVAQTALTWNRPFGPSGPAFGYVAGTYGDKHPASFFVKMSAGSDSGWHTHTEDYVAVVVEGTFSAQQAGDVDETELATGTYFTQPGKQVHRNHCAKGHDCLVYVHFDHGADSTPTSRDGKATPH